ncbi:hypothetical protein HYDPIDRAFT_109242 [Hydnomerulius pinastri MD-312]|nr:hypothetical protein HYDPIDRAFT_109242 [Hydnomerulius pinastri MD-312]
MPMKRETFAFHYATLDGPPTLRTLTVCGEESRDYIARQATLSVKSNGVYTVLGMETFSIATPSYDGHGSRSENVKLRWKFDYLVGDRRVDASGKTLPGEKTLTPLTFSCSPYLLHPLQGKKTGLMHIVKKNLVPKLASEKVEPPMCPLSSKAPPRHSRHPSTRRGPSTHTRSRSDAYAKIQLRKEPMLDCSGPSSPLGAGERGRGTGQMQYTRRRRASSAGEHSLPPMKEYAHVGPAALRRPPMATHMMPHAELLRMITPAK